MSTLKLIMDELNRYDMNCYIKGDELVFVSFPGLTVVERASNFVITSYLNKEGTLFDYSCTQPTQVIRFILGGLWYESK